MSEIKDKRGNRPKKTNAQKVMMYSDGKGIENYKFSYIIPSINQYAVLSNNWELDYIDIAIFLTIYNFIGSGRADKLKITDDKGVSWYYVSEHKIIKDLPLVPVNNESSVRKRITKLCKYNLIIRKPDNSKTGKKYIKIGENSQKLFYTNPNNTQNNNTLNQ